MPQHWFDYHKPSEAQVETIQALREGCKALCALIEETLPACRARSMALTKLEEVSMWANKAAVFGEESNR